MLTKKERHLIRKCAKKYHASSVFLFGSSIKEKGAHDIDLAVKGISPRTFFDFYAELFKQLPKPVDLVDLDGADSYFASRILEESKLIYEG